MLVVAVVAPVAMVIVAPMAMVIVAPMAMVTTVAIPTIGHRGRGKGHGANDNGCQNRARHGTTSPKNGGVEGQRALSRMSQRDPRANGSAMENLAEGNEENEGKGRLPHETASSFLRFLL
jgi:hypothetical protein